MNFFPGKLYQIYAKPHHNFREVSFFLHSFFDDDPQNYDNDLIKVPSEEKSTMMFIYSFKPKGSFYWWHCFLYKNKFIFTDDYDFATMSHSFTIKQVL